MTAPRGFLDALCPLHARLDARGRILHAGPTLRKLRAPRDLLGRPFAEVFCVTRPRLAGDAGALAGLAGRALHLRFLDPPCTAFRGLALPLPDGGGTLLNLSFGIALAEAVRTHDLRNSDFAPTDLAMEMLYLLEAKAVTLSASRQLNRRLQMAKARAETTAVSDSLTGLANRRGFLMALDKALARGRPFALMQIDLDHFKQVNDSAGHAAGDFVLCEVARAMHDATRGRDVLARIGGDEFVVLLPDDPGHADVLQVADRLLADVARPRRWQEREIRLSCSIGSVHSSDYAAPDPDLLLAHADQALYRAKAAGRGRHVLHRKAPAGAAQDPPSGDPPAPDPG